MSDKIEHYIAECYNCGIMAEHVILCSCGEKCCGDTWEDCGAGIDEHFAEVSEKRSQ